MNKNKPKILISGRKALKRLKLISSEDDRDLATTEINLLKSLNNVNVIKYLDSFIKTSKDDEDNETFQYFIVTDYFKVNFAYKLFYLI